MWEENSSTNEVVDRFFGDFLHALDQLFGQMVASELFDEFVVIDFFVGAARYGVWIDSRFLLLWLSLRDNLLLLGLRFRVFLHLKNVKLNYSFIFDTFI